MPGEERGCKDWERVMEGYLDQRIMSKHGKLKRRWVVFQGSRDAGLYQLTVYKKKNERHTSEIHTISKDTFIGTEKGKIYCKKQGMKIMYWALILKSATPIFQELEQNSLADDSISIENWHMAIKSRFEIESWQVNPVSGVSPKSQAESSLTMFMNKHRLGLVTLTPPECCEQWALSTITDCQAYNNTLFVYIDSEQQTGLGALAYHEVQLRMTSLSDAQRARDVLNRLRSKSNDPKNSTLEPPSSPNGRGIQGGQLKANPLYEQIDLSGHYTPSPTSPRKSTPFVFPKEQQINNDTVRGPAPPPPPPRPQMSLGSESPEYSVPQNLSQSDSDD